jgi:hypothetical protein
MVIGPGRQAGGAPGRRAAVCGQPLSGGIRECVFHVPEMVNQMCPVESQRHGRRFGDLWEVLWAQRRRIPGADGGCGFRVKVSRVF